MAKARTGRGGHGEQTGNLCDQCRSHPEGDMKDAALEIQTGAGCHGTDAAGPNLQCAGRACSGRTTGDARVGLHTERHAHTVQPAGRCAIGCRPDPAASTSIPGHIRHATTRPPLLVELRQQRLLGIGRHAIQRDRWHFAAARRQDVPERGRGDAVPLRQRCTRASRGRRQAHGGAQATHRRLVQRQRAAILVRQVHDNRQTQS